MARRVAITGLGMTTPLGGDVTSTWEKALAGQSGVRSFTADWVKTYDLPVTFGGTIAVPPSEVLARSEIKRMDPSAQYALIAAREAWRDAGSPQVDKARLATVVSSGIGGVWTLLDAWDTLREKGPRRVLPMTVPMLMPNSPAAYVSLEFGGTAGSHAPVSACASGAEAIGYAADLVATGRADVVVAGGTEAPIHPCPIAAFAAMRATSTRGDDPQGASRPYDVNRDGFVMAEGSGVMVLESEEHARARGARIYGFVGGVGMTSDGYHIAAPEPTGASQLEAMRIAITGASLTPADIVHLNAHATSTPVGDMIEARAVAELFGAGQVAVSATKSMTGHALGGAGAIESIFVVLALHHRLAPPTINVTDPEPDLQIDLVRDTPRSLPGGDIAALNNSFGFGGHDVAVVFTSA